MYVSIDAQLDNKADGPNQIFYQARWIWFDSSIAPNREVYELVASGTDITNTELCENFG